MTIKAMCFKYKCIMEFSDDNGMPLESERADRKGQRVTKHKPQGNTYVDIHTKRLYIGLDM